ncbi:MAG: hypothetical protein LBR73_03035 [Oscillospiraceae bacterium]|jgi:MFS superfamily sulfate permease-like transporter|nr:hypothetical protein [Oscillospiraceae bacterium]
MKNALRYIANVIACAAALLGAVVCLTCSTASPAGKLNAGFLLLLSIYLGTRYWTVAAGVVSAKPWFPKLAALPRAALLGVLGGLCAQMVLYAVSGIFGIGAQGEWIGSLLKAYKAVGFHPNFAALLMAAVVLLCLLLWQRELPRLSKVLPGGLVGLAAAVGLCLLLYGYNSAMVPVYGGMPVAALSMLWLWYSLSGYPWGAAKALFWRGRPAEIALFTAGFLLGIVL